MVGLGSHVPQVETPTAAGRQQGRISAEGQGKHRPAARHDRSAEATPGLHVPELHLALPPPVELHTVRVDRHRKQPTVRAEGDLPDCSTPLVEHGGWATIYSPRSAIEARVIVTERMKPIVVHGRRTHQIGLPYHWGGRGLTTGDSANDLSTIVLDPNAHIQEVKAFTVGIRAGLRPRGKALPDLVEELRSRAGAADRSPLS
jgi:hypothetical protein